MQPFEYQLTTRLVFGPNRVEQLGELAKEFGAQRVLIVSDPGIVKAGHTQRGVAALHACGLRVLDLEANYLQGSLADAWGDLTELRDLNVRRSEEE